MNIRRATIDDIPQILPLWRQLSDMHSAMEPMWHTVDDVEEKHQDHLKASLVKDSFCLVVAEAGGAIIGFATMSFGTKPEIFVKTWSASIQDTYVKPEYQKTGIGRQMIKALVGFAKQKDVELITLSVATENDGAYKFWKKTGFKHTMNSMTMYLD